MENNSKIYVAGHRGLVGSAREFLHVDDMADACVFLMTASMEGDDLPFSPARSLINIGAGKDVTISGLAEIVCEVTGFQMSDVRRQTSEIGSQFPLVFRCFLSSRT